MAANEGDKMRIRRLFGSFSGASSGAAAVLSASAGACAGGVCAVGVSAGSGIIASSSGPLASMIAASGAQVYSGAGTAPMQNALPWWLKVAIAVLILSIAYTAAALRDHPWLAIQATLGGLLVVVAELRWLPGGVPVEYLAIGTGLVPLMLAPLLARVTFSEIVSSWIRWILSGMAVGALALVFFFQFAWAWHPCALCWMERLDLVLLVGMLIGRKNATLVALVGLALVGAQLTEIQHGSTFLSNLCSTMSPQNCATAGQKLLLGWPIGYWSAVFFWGLWSMIFVINGSGISQKKEPK